MSLIRLQDSVPDIYVNNSRDFQLFCRLYDCVNNGVKYDIDSMQNIIDTDLCDAKLLQLLQSKLGFITNVNIDNESLRYVLRAFPEIMKNKGSKKAIIQCLNVFAKIKNIKSNIDCIIINKEYSNGIAYNVYKIKVIINASPDEIPLVKDTTILDELFQYIIPTGYTVEYSFSTAIQSSISISQSDDVAVLQYANNEDSTLRGGDDTYAENTAASRITTAADTANITNTETV